MRQIRITGRELRPDDYLRGGIGASPDPRQRVRRVIRGDLNGRATVAACIGGHDGIGARKIFAPDDPVVVWRQV